MAEEVTTTTVDLEQGDEEMETETVTLDEFYKSQEELIEHAAAVLGAGDDKNCTYAEGYMKRQPLYACLTCIPEAKVDVTKRAGVCLACSYNCHDGHELIELYTKRSFRCDCGNEKFGDMKCSFDNTKSGFNELNSYNHNFSGLYCTCSRPYPDPEDKVSDEMIQCIICEDWFHSRHLGVDLPPSSSFGEMTCESCVKKHPFILHYDGLCVKKVTPDESNTSINVEVTASDSTVSTLDDTGTALNTTVENSIKTSADENQVPEENKGDIDNTKAVNVETSQPSSSDNTVGNNADVCKKPKNKSDQVTTKFWGDISWRQQLCTCPDCLKLYEEEKVSFLLDPQDPSLVYEEKGKEKHKEIEEKKLDTEMKYLNSLDRVSLLETIASYNDFKENLVEYLKKFAENKKVIRTEDIKEFFEELNSRKKQKLDVQFSCR